MVVIFRILLDYPSICDFCVLFFISLCFIFHDECPENVFFNTFAAKLDILSERTLRFFLEDVSPYHLLKNLEG